MTPEEIAAMKAENEKLKTESAARATADKEAKDKTEKEAKDKADKEAKDKEGKGGDDLRDKIAKEKEAGAKSAAELKVIENSLKFNLSVADFVKGNADVLPAEIPEILRAAEKEKYDTAGEKASAVKSAFIQSFFGVQAHVDLLTTSQKATLDDYLKMTKNAKTEKAEAVYENIFEPALETLKKVKKAEELGKSRLGFASGSKVEDGYKQRLIAGSRKTYLNEKGA